MPETLLDRTTQFIGDEGIARLRSLRVAIVGVGGIGTHVVQQLAFLRVGHLCLIDPGGLKGSNRNRYPGTRQTDQDGTLKTRIGARIVSEIDPTIRVQELPSSFVTEEGFASLQSSDYVFGCLDHDGARYVLNEFCSAYQRRYIDIASEITPGLPPDLGFGGRICISHSGQGCLYCREGLDPEEITAFGLSLSGDLSPRPGCDQLAITVPGGGPAIVNLNGIVASIAVTEFLMWVTGIRQPVEHYRYRGMSAILSKPEPTIQSIDCHICSSVYGKGADAAMARYLPHRRV